MEIMDDAHPHGEPTLPAVTMDRRPLTDQVAEYVRDLIIQDVLKPGEPINVQAICETLQISQTPLREALKMLAAQRLVEMQPNKRVLVASLNTAEIEQMLVVYTEMEKLAGRLAAQSATALDIRALQKQEKALMAAFNAGESLRYFHANQEFHLALVRASHNDTLVEMHGNLNARLYHTRFKGNQRNNRQGHWQAVAQEHALILQAIIDKDGDLCAALLSRHLNGARFFLREKAE
ncbi:GntR family transcriptional regulator [Affinibrenneria salicis]|uniref:GntR family transcriptional regulator n=1 Tax=Affinibrenneria salicis TaxID=2590031 RepID=A0A5J5G6C0_9GAMM|nr:GntR family transcriptional regulator [Affinibrenneria salicis]KAA9002776.1 GntR family transcriptional regulator [Affinibrenneria salicis]KAA9002937.1 GntR family transcriptional regulator [Affinibrenneria salicis]